MSGQSEQVKEFYKTYYDPIFEKRYNSPFWLRRYAHRTRNDFICRYIAPGQKVLDAGCGDGVLSVLMAQKGASVTCIDLSIENVRAARRRASELAVGATFIVGDAEQLPFANDSFDLVVSCHVIEHLPNSMRGLRELHRVTKDQAVIAMPTCLNSAAWALLGGDGYWKLSKRSLVAIPLGLFRTLSALVRGEEGPQEGYAGHNELPHVWRFPWVVLKMLRAAGFSIAHYGADSLLTPYFAEYLSVARWLQCRIDKWADRPVVKYFGWGSHVLCHKSRELT